MASKQNFSFISLFINRLILRDSLSVLGWNECMFTLVNVDICMSHYESKFTVLIDSDSYDIVYSSVFYERHYIFEWIHSWPSIECVWKVSHNYRRKSYRCKSIDLILSLGGCVCVKWNSPLLDTEIYFIYLCKVDWLL